MRTWLPSSSGSITSVLQETRVFPPPAEFASDGHISSLDQYQALWNRAKDDPEGFWAEQAQRLLSWFKPWDKVLEWNAPVCQVVRGRPAQRLVQLPRPALRRARARTRPP